MKTAWVCGIHLSQGSIHLLIQIRVEYIATLTYPIQSSSMIVLQVYTQYRKYLGLGILVSCTRISYHRTLVKGKGYFCRWHEPKTLLKSCKWGKREYTIRFAVFTIHHFLHSYLACWIIASQSLTMYNLHYLTTCSYEFLMRDINSGTSTLNSLSGQKTKSTKAKIKELDII